ncbi:MAG: YgeY family selenium metabolism-linked hydrolase [Desulfatiglandaceae bacterium]
MSIDFDAMIGFLQSLVQTESLSCREKPAMELIAREMNRLGYEDVGSDEYGNTVGVIHGAHRGPTLLLDAHTDTVGIAPGVDWEHDPFGAVIEENRMYGRGTADMKGALAAMLHAGAALDRSRIAGRIVFSASVMEEVVEGFPLDPVIKRFRPDFVLIGEATDLNISHGGRGRAEIHLETIGRPAHSSTPHLGANAALMMIEAVRSAEALVLPSDPDVGDAIMALTDIISEPYPGHSMIPSRCRVTYDRRTLPGETEEIVLAPFRKIGKGKAFKAAIGEARYTTYTGVEIRVPKFFPAWKLDTRHELVQRSFNGLRSAGLAPEFRFWQFCTNAAYTAGLLGIPTAGFGPCREGQAHTVDEFIDLTDLKRAAGGYLGIIQHVLAIP